MMKELAAMQAVLEAVKRVEEETLKENQSLPTDSCSEDQSQKYLLSQMDSILDIKPSNKPPPLLEENMPPNSSRSGPLQADSDRKPFFSATTNEASQAGPYTSSDFNPCAPPFFPRKTICS